MGLTTGPPGGVPWMALYYYTLTPDQVCCCYSATNAWLLPLCSQASFCSGGWADRAQVAEHLEPIKIGPLPWSEPLTASHCTWIHSGFISIPWGCARSGLRLPFKPSHLFYDPRASWHSDYIAFLSVVWITQAFSSLKVFVHRTFLAWAITPPWSSPTWLQGSHEIVTSSESLFPLWPHPTTPLPLRSLRASCSFVIVHHTVFDSGPCLFLFPVPPGWTKD